MDFNSRLNFYLGKRFSQGDFKVSKKQLINIKEISAGNTRIYKFPLINLLTKYHHQDKLFQCQLGDISEKNNIFALCKNRSGSCPDGVILRILAYGRHWDNYYRRPKDIPFNKKISRVFWRGTTTSLLNQKANRFDLIKQWFNKDNRIDIGFSHICQDQQVYQKYVKGLSPISHFLKHKYILSVRGNDKDSGLQWKLNSNSVVLMAKPTVTTWLMETTLIPNFHYVLLKDDFSDLLKQYQWCQDNPDKCQQIIQNAHNYMKQFANKKKELLLEKAVIDNYFNILTQNMID